MVFFCLLAVQYCIGLSIGPFNNPQASMFLQLKNVSSQPIFERMDWVINPDFSLSSTFNQQTSVGLISDNDLLIRAGNLRILKFPLLNTSLGLDDWTTLQDSAFRCVTAMKCNQGKLGFCDTNSDDPVQSEGDISLGSYLKLNPCLKNNQGIPVISQLFRQINHNCSTDKLQSGCNTKEKGCNFPVFNCPSLQPSIGPSLQPSIGPSPQPSLGPFLRPSSHPTSFTLTEMTPEPTLLPATSSPSQGEEEEEEKGGGGGIEVLSVLFVAVLPLGFIVLYVKGLWPF